MDPFHHILRNSFSKYVDVLKHIHTPVWSLQSPTLAAIEDFEATF